MCFHLQLQVVGVKLTKSDLLDEISHQRCIVKAKSCSSLDSHEDASVNAYSDDFNEATRGGLQAGRKVKDCLTLVVVVCQCTIINHAICFPQSYS